jgi:hypothetical protein
MMSYIDLPHAVEAYFAFAELPAFRQERPERRFTITFTYFEGEKLDRLQWWYQVGAAQERSGGEMALAAARREAVERFRAHIETWLVNSQRCLRGGEPFPFLEPLVVAPAEVPAEPVRSAQVVSWPGTRAASQGN